MQKVQMQLTTAWRDLVACTIAFHEHCLAEACFAWYDHRLHPDWADFGHPVPLAEPTTKTACLSDDLHWCLSTLNRLEFFDGQAAQETLAVPGLLGLGPTSYAAALTLNDARTAFKAAVLSLRHLTKLDDEGPTVRTLLDKEQGFDRDPATGRMLRKNGLARLALKQCYRHLPILPERPVSVRWTWARTNAIVKKTAAEVIAEIRASAYDRANNLQGTLLDRDILKLTALPPATPLAWVQQLAPHLRANIVYAKSSALTAKMIPAALPIVYPALPGDPIPNGGLLKGPTSDKSRRTKSDRKPRKDKKIESTPFLSTWPIYRYIR